MQPGDQGQLVGRWPEDLAAASMALARRFSAHGTLWCWSPRWPQHAEHVAVEFVHPVIVGKRALPAVAVADADPVAALRALTEAGDVVLVVADSSTPGVDRVLRRAPAWGVETIWIGSGPRPADSGADHLLWFDDAGDEAAFTGAFVLAYHVLWELTHVCFEHPGLLKPSAGTGDCADEHCITCSDEGRLAEVVRPAGPGTVVVRTPEGLEDVDTTLVDPVGSGDLLLVHAGVALSRLDGDPVPATNGPRA
ncbi:MAG: hydrogenase assembly protein HupF [Acidimicrobiales bacterium]